MLWRAALDQPVIFQPAVSGGRAYAATGAGSLFAIGTGDPRSEGWPMWSGSAAHNGIRSWFDATVARSFRLASGSTPQQQATDVALVGLPDEWH